MAAALLLGVGKELEDGVGVARLDVCEIYVAIHPFGLF
jgi:hypothetical protein